jgi:hypothetical protein
MSAQAVREREKRRETLLRQPENSQELPEPNKRWAVLGLMGERYTANIPPFAIMPLVGFRRPKSVNVKVAEDAFCGVDEAELLAKWYERPSDYWEAWLFNPLPAEILARLLARHMAKSVIQFEAIKRDVLAALQSESAPSGATRETVEWLATKNPDTEHFIPPSLRAFLTPAAPAATIAEKSRKPSPRRLTPDQMVRWLKHRDASRAPGERPPHLKADLTAFIKDHDGKPPTRSALVGARKAVYGRDYPGAGRPKNSPAHNSPK